MAKQKVKGPGKVSARGRKVAIPKLAPETVPAKPKLKVTGKRKGLTGTLAALAGAAFPRAGKQAVKRKAKVAGKTKSSPIARDLVAPLVAEPGAIAPVARRRAIRPGGPPARLERLEAAIAEVRIGARNSPRTRKLLASGIPKMAQKVIEEAAEAAIEAVRGERLAFVQESVDLLYNWLVLCAEFGVPLAEIWAEMERRELTLGMAEKLPKAPDSAG